MRLCREDNAAVLLENLEVARSQWSRTRGLLGRKDLPQNQGLWILRCNSIHTFFMNFAIDLVFLNKKMVVTKVMHRVPPGRLVWPVWRASSVIELREGFLQANPIRVGEKLNVDPTLS